MKKKMPIQEAINLLRRHRGHLRDGELSALNEFIKEVIPQAPRIPLSLWQTVMSRAVPVSIELVLVRDGKVFLTERCDQFFKGVHFPGTYLNPGETFVRAAKRCAQKELGVKVVSGRIVGEPVNHPNSKRFHDCSILFHCTFSGKPRGGKWYAKKPKNLIAAQNPYWKIVRTVLDK